MDDGFEDVQLGDTVLSLPSSWLASSVLDSVFSLRTWNSIPTETQSRLVKLLPWFPENDQKEKIATLKMLLTPGRNIKFGNPVDQFKEKLINGGLHPESVKMNRIMHRIQRRHQREIQRQSEFKLMADLIRQVTNPVGKNENPAPPSHPSQKTTKFEARVASQYLKELRMIRREVGEHGNSSDDDEILNQCEADSTLTKRDVERMYFEYKRGVSGSNNHLLKTSVKRKRTAENSLEPKSLLIKSPKSLLKTAGPPVSVLKPKSLLLPKATSPGSKSASFFSILRDKFSSYPNRRTLLSNVVKDLEVLEPDCEVQVTSALKFLMGSFPKDQHPPGFVALVKFNPLTGTYTWTAGDDGQDDSDDKLSLLDGIWRHREQPQEQQQLELEEFHAQEAERMSNPWSPFTYRIKGALDVVVGPVRANQVTTKVKNHPLLVPDRPPHVTIIVLVQEAIARLPAGQGTKADICALVKQSQYVNHQPPSGGGSSLSTVVSGALDRLQGENDPPCKYIPELRMWRNLHQGRTETDYSIKMNSSTTPKAKRSRKESSVAKTLPQPPEEEEKVVVQSAIDSILPPLESLLPQLPCLPLSLSSSSSSLQLGKKTTPSQVCPSGTRQPQSSILKANQPSPGPAQQQQGSVKSGHGRQSLLLSSLPVQHHQGEIKNIFSSRSVVEPTMPPKLSVTSSGSKKKKSSILNPSRSPSVPEPQQGIAKSGNGCQSLLLPSQSVHHRQGQHQSSILKPNQSSSSSAQQQGSVQGGDGGQSLLLTSQPVQHHQREFQNPFGSGSVVEPTSVPSARDSAATIGRRQIILTGTASSATAVTTSSQVIIRPPIPHQQQQQQSLVQASIGGKTVLLTRDQLKKMGLGNMRIAPNGPQ